MTWSAGTLLSTACVLGTIAGCAPQPMPTVMVADSAGIRIVETGAALWKGSAWTLSDRPLLTIGRQSGAAHEEFFGIAGVALMRDGRIVVADGSAGQLRFFGSDGSFLRAVGRTGSGPGEFRGLNRLYALADDTLLAFDGVLYRFTVFNSAGELERVFSPEAEEGLVFPLATIGRGQILVGSAVPFGQATTTGIHIDSANALVADLRGTIHESVGRFPFYERYVRAEGGFRSTIGRPFGRETRMAGGDGRLYVTTSDAYQVYVYDGSRLEQIFRIDRPLRSVTETDVVRYLDSRRQITNERRRQVEARLLGEIPFPATFPPFSALLLDTEQHLWAAEYKRPGERRTRWFVFDPDGAWLGTVEGPDGFRAHQISRDRVLGVHVDELGVEQVRIYGLRRSSNKHTPVGMHLLSCPRNEA